MMVLVAAPNPYSNTLIASIASQGSHTIQLRERPSISRSVSPMRYTLPLASTTSLYVDGIGVLIFTSLLVLRFPLFDWCGVDLRFGSMKRSGGATVDCPAGSGVSAHRGAPLPSDDLAMPEYSRLHTITPSD